VRLLSRFGSYGSVAMLSAGGDWVIFSLLVSLLGAGHLASLMTARIVGGVTSFVGNRYWTWAARRQIAITQQGRRFLLLYGFSYVLSVALFSLFTAALRLPPYPAKLITDTACFVVNFVVMHHYVFHARRGLSGLRQ
jgi:putative flippase GtrA